MLFQYYIMGFILLPGLILSIYAQIKVSSAYEKYSQIGTHKNIPAVDLIRRLASNCDMDYLKINKIPGNLTDNYNPQDQTINLSQGIYDSTSVSALGIACHEFGHALQNKKRYFPYQVRRVLVPITNISSRLLWPLVLIGLLLNLGAESGSLLGDIFLWSGIGFFGIAILFNLATLPVEYDASRRAIKILDSLGILNEEELAGTKKVLNAAALTYVAALVVSILNFLRFFLIIMMGRNRR